MRWVLSLWCVFYERQRGEVTVTAGNEATVTVNLQPSGRNIPSMR